ncbi:MobA/MobL family protein, partial [Acinetobacter sp. SwsAc6]|uniref:MobA/MobL family protein n=1 Tax=Acinetobacter sp. SwsAc6 TaxID=2749439 RepID=UPI0015B79108
AQVAREFEFSLPHELNAEQRKNMVRMFCTWLAKNHGVVVDASIHAPHGKNADERNYHVHVMFSTRRFENGQFTEKTREFSKDPYNQKELEKRRRKGLEDFSQRLHGRKNATELLREACEKIGNKCLVDAGFEPTLDRRSYAEQGIDKEPTIHEGAGRAMANRGLQSDTHDKNIEIIERNKKLSELDLEIQASNALLNRIDVEYDALRALQTQIQQQFFKNEQMQKRAEKVLDMCLRPEDFHMSSLCCELVDHKPDLSSNREKTRADAREAIAEIALDILNDEIGKIDLAVVEKHELQAFTDYLRKELGDYSKDEMLITYTTENSAERSSENVAEVSRKPDIRNDYNSPEL